MLLELLNMEGDKKEKAEGVKLANKVTVEIEKYKGKLEMFQHEFRSTLRFAIPKRQDSANSSQSSSRNNSIDRRYSRIHDHHKPNKVCWEDTLEVVLKFQEEFQIWMIEVSRVSGSDKDFVWNLLMTLLDAEWTKRMKEDKSLKNKDLEKIFEKMNLILLDRSPLVARMIDFERIKKGANELPSAFMERMFSNLSSSQMDIRVG